MLSQCGGNKDIYILWKSGDEMLIANCELRIANAIANSDSPHYCPQNNTAGRQYYIGTKLPGGRIV